MSYNKKVWKSGDRITKEALNNMENGIEAAHQNSGGTGSVAIVDNLNSNSSTSALSAKQGKELNNKMPAKSIVEGGKIYLAKEDGTKLDNNSIHGRKQPKWIYYNTRNIRRKISWRRSVIQKLIKNDIKRRKIRNTRQS